MEMELFFILMGIDLKELIKMEKRMEKVLIILKLEKNLLENGLKMKEMEKELWLKKMEKLKNNLSKMEKWKKLKKLKETLMFNIYDIIIFYLIFAII